MAEDQKPTKSGRELERDEYSPVWGHKNGDERHRADEHYDGTGHWVCHDCREPIKLLQTHLLLTVEAQDA